MKAAVFTEYGPPEVLHLSEVAEPVPEDRDVLVRVRATSVNFGDSLVRNFRAVSPRKFHMPFGLRDVRTHLDAGELAPSTGPSGGSTLSLQ